MSATPRSSQLVSASAGRRVSTALAARHGGATGRPGLRADLVIRRQVNLGEVTWLVKHPESQKLFSFDEASWSVIELFDGTRPHEEIAQEYRNRHPGTDLPLSMVTEYEDSLRRMDLIAQTTTERHLGMLDKLKDAKQRAREERAEGFNIFFMLFHVFDPDRFLGRTLPAVSWLWSPAAVAVAFVFFGMTVAVFIQHIGPIWRETLVLYSFLKKPFLDMIQFFIILSVIGAIHELGHGYVTKRYGGEVHDMGLALVYFTPAFYCDTTDAYLFPTKWQRLWVTMAGIYIESLLCVLATALWVVTYPDTLAHEIAYKTMLYTGVSTVFFQINPLIKTDGYNALSSVLEMPEFREDAFQYVGALIQKHVLRLPIDVPFFQRRKRLLFVPYVVLACLYTGTIMGFITKLFYNFYARYFPEIAGVLLVPTFLRLFRKRIRKLVDVLKLFYLDKKESIMAPRNRLRLISAAAIGLAVLVVPWSHRGISSDITLAPASEHALEAPEDAFVTKIFVREGDVVESGTPLLALDSPSLDTETERLASERSRLAHEASLQRGLAQAGSVYLAETELRAAEASFSSISLRRQRLEVRAPSRSRVLTARPGELVGRFVRQGDPLLTLGDCRRLTAVIPVTERLLTDLAVGSEVKAQMLAFPSTPLTGRIISVAPAAVAAGQRNLDRAATLRPSEMPDRFVAIARFDNPRGDFLPGMEGRVRIHGARASYLARVWRVTRRWIQTIFW